LVEIYVDNVSKTYRDNGTRIEVLKCITLELRARNLYCISGPSGSGKTTLLNIVSRLDIPDSGNVKVDGIWLKDLTENEMAKLRTSSYGIVFQNSNLVGHLTTIENVLFPTLFLQVSVEGSLNRLKARAEDLLRRLSLGDKSKKIPIKLSEGERRRVAIARALVCNPKIVVADEPTMNLDAENVQRVMDLFKEVRDEGAVILVSSHDTNVSESCDRVFEIRYGEIS
jgi:ABC-type lipoprotein export system ATPase subunit